MKARKCGGKGNILLPVMAALCILGFSGCNSSTPAATVTGASEVTSSGNAVSVTKGSTLQFYANVIWSDGTTTNEIT
jgi:hypothetical protein